MQDKFRSRINKNAIGWIKTMLDGIQNDNSMAEGYSNSQENSKNDYKGRFFYELLQNARDVNLCTKIAVILKGDRLFFCNDGTPVLEDNFESLCTHAKSSKSNNEEQTGKYGIGKASYYEISSTNHRIYSKSDQNGSCFDGYCFELASDRAVQYQEVLENLSKICKSSYFSRQHCAVFFA